MRTLWDDRGGRDCNGVNRRTFLVLAGGAGVALGTIGCDAAMSGDPGDGADPMDAVPALSDEETMSLRRQRYRRYALDGLDSGFDNFDSELAGRYSADLFTHVF